MQATEPDLTGWSHSFDLTYDLNICNYDRIDNWIVASTGESQTELEHYSSSAVSRYFSFESTHT